MQRLKCQITDCDITRIKDFSKQYFKTYCVRLNSCIEILEKKINEKLGENSCIKKLSEIQSGERCVIMGTLYKKMDNKPSVIKEWTDSYQLGILPIPPHKLISKGDIVILEDFQQRIQLHFDEVNIKTASLVTGIVCAVVGQEPESDKGKFFVEDIIYPTPFFPFVKNIVQNDNRAQYIAIISGIQVNEDTMMNSIRLKLFFDWLSGVLPVNSLPIDPKTVGRLIVAGNSIDENGDDLLVGQNKIPLKKSEVNISNVLVRLDELLCGVCRSIPVDIMSGQLDLTSTLLPQKPMHRVLFHHSSKWSSFNPRPNPWQCSLEDGSFIIGISGQTIDDIDRYSDIDDVLDRMEATIKWGHLGPTAPDTLPSYPNDGLTDPLIMLHRPHLYFAGNQDKLSWRLLHYPDTKDDSTLLVTIPRFSTTGQIVLVDLFNHNCQTLTFK